MGDRVVRNGSDLSLRCIFRSPYFPAIPQLRRKSTHGPVMVMTLLRGSAHSAVAHFGGTTSWCRKNYFVTGRYFSHCCITNPGFAVLPEADIPSPSDSQASIWSPP